MAEPQQVPAGPEQEAPSGIPPGGEDRQGALTQMITQTDQALTGIAQVLAKASPEAGQAMAALGEQYRQIITAVMNQGEQQQQAPQQRPVSPMVSPETQGKPAMPAY